MVHKGLPPVAREDLKRHLLCALQQYWSGNAEVVAELPIWEAAFPEVRGPLKLALVRLPSWAAQCGVDGRIAVPCEACLNPDGAVWQDVDWWLAAFLMIECWHERAWELEHGPIHSYSLRLSGWDARAWDHAWVNRIALFLRGWGVQQARIPEEVLFGALPEPQFVMTHDVDAVSKTMPIRLKQGAFNLFNAGRAMFRGNVRQAIDCLGQAARFLFGGEAWWTIDRLIEQERQAGIRSHFNFFADQRRKTLMRWLFDPGYDVHAQRLSRLIKEIQRDGWTIGLHPTFDAWQDHALICSQRKNLEAASGTEVKTCRQHWLRFAWGHTWAAQHQAGIRLDATLMFNDRPGFRAAAVLQWHPWDPATQSSHSLQVLPTVLMDSHVYDYQPMAEPERQTCMARWLDEIRQVHGRAAFLWHPHTLTRDYGWQSGFDGLLAEMKGMQK
jgi:hypothetical protein